jgi:hypothetical protein
MGDGHPMNEVACFCGAAFCFPGDVGVCPACGEYTTFSVVSASEVEQMRNELNVLFVNHADVEPEPQPRHRPDRT